MRAIVRVILRETTDEEAIKVKKLIETALKDIKQKEIELSTMG